MKTFRNKRNFEIARKVFTTDRTLKDIASEYKITHSAIAQKACTTMRILRHPKYLNGDIIPETFESSNRTVTDIRKHRDFWIKQLDKFEKHFNFEE